MKVSERAYWCIWIPLFLIICAIMLVGCSDPHKNMHCVQSHDETVPIYGNHVFSSGKTTVVVPYVMYYAQDNVCDKWVPNN